MSPAPALAEAVAPAAECTLHEGAPAVAACVRCGRFVCADCLGSRRLAAPTEPECPHCRVRGAERRRDRAIRNLRTERWISLLVLGVIIGVTSATLAVPEARREFGADPLFIGLAAFLVGVITGMPLWIAAACFAAERRVWLVWLGLTFELVGLMQWLSVLPDENRARLFVWPLAVYGISRTWRLRSLVVRRAATAART